MEGGSGRIRDGQWKGQCGKVRKHSEMNDQQCLCRFLHEMRSERVAVSGPNLSETIA